MKIITTYFVSNNSTMRSLVEQRVIARQKELGFMQKAKANANGFQYARASRD